MKKTLYPYGFWWLGLVGLISMICIDIFFYRRFSEIRTPTIFILVFMLFIFGFPHREVSVRHKSNKGLLITSKAIFYTSLLTLFSVFGMLLITIDPEFRNVYKVYNVNKLEKIVFLLVEIFIVTNLIFTILVILLRFKKA